MPKSEEDKVKIGKYKTENASVTRAPVEIDGEGMTAAVRAQEATVEVLSHIYEKSLPGGEDCGDQQDTLKLLFRGLSIPLANTLRRLLISEVPVMAFDSVVIEENEGVVFDESLSHRIGLVPIQCDPDQFEFVKDIAMYDSPHASPAHFLKFTLNVVAENDLTSVYSGDLKWVPLPGQEKLYSLNVKPVNEKILLCKLAKGRKLSLCAYAVKGIGLNHAKWSPVSCSTYKLRPQVEVNPRSPKISEETASCIVRNCPVNVFELEDSGKIRVANPDACTGCRECIREAADEEEPPILLARNKNELIFTIESIGQLSAMNIIEKALKNFATHCEYLNELIESNVQKV
ncbi:hypothetical protein XU18_3002 [Perkinsela sp. CCAP 1560/4]|nr:hypothetical protein XU18_3002 [Perkinsela sp. CCAP 1560/4]|eukprot:KNH06065.1 hypothetical protein XU18_3002 [Perkinsela sp. CCAP 1560/4]